MFALCMCVSVNYIPLYFSMVFVMLYNIDYIKSYMLWNFFGLIIYNDVKEMVHDLQLFSKHTKSTLGKNRRHYMLKR